jgi:hypothetical protein
MAESELRLCANQLRFLSRYFLRAGEILNHGAEILGGYLADKKFVDDVAEEKAEKDLFSFQDFCIAIKWAFPADHDAILADFVRMIGFDTLVGNQDRHFYNWGVITHPKGAITPRLAPIYDTARGLFWNTTEQKLVRYGQTQALAAYVWNSTPQIGWNGWDSKKNGDLRHFQLIENIASSDDAYCVVLEKLGKEAMAALPECQGMIDAEFGDLLTEARRDLIKQCLTLRFQQFDKIF